MWLYVDVGLCVDLLVAKLSANDVTAVVVICEHVVTNRTELVVMFDVDKSVWKRGQIEVGMSWQQDNVNM